ncbi:pirin family protein [Psychrobacter sp. FDAARGOS_221]|uniref:pirin family protein n=1 Tax=Psychrobacter sp. FDAARGOS_221 TaxID=1975705 RepID=UPI000BB55AD1|nr:pirin family protein [Psychrobacter sp. FDAARGOS_221]PNK60675.1 pirin family protein [Psychrobacter sp. FDAARGOS_221]
MKTVYHAAGSRGGSHHGWLKSKHTFSFADYYNPQRVGFGALRVINDDHVDGGTGFGDHSHANMEIISIPLSGKLMHGDSMGNHGVIESGEIQVMSAGTGIVHSEMNGDDEKPVKFLQIWVVPNTLDVEPRYQQKCLRDLLQRNQFNQVLSPDPEDAGVWIYQNAWFSIGEFDKGITTTYALRSPLNGVYVFVISGSVVINGHTLEGRDGLGITDTKNFTMDVIENAQVLLMDVPMSF